MKSGDYHTMGIDIHGEYTILQDQIEPKKGYGIGQLCNRTNDPEKVNAEIKYSKINQQTGIWIRSTKEIKKGEEIITQSNPFRNNLWAAPRPKRQKNHEEKSVDEDIVTQENTNHNTSGTNRKRKNTHTEINCNRGKQGKEGKHQSPHPQEQRRSKYKKNDNTQHKNKHTNQEYTMKQIIEGINKKGKKGRLQPMIRELMNKHLHTEDSLNETFTTWRGIGAWHSECKIEQTLGATAGEEESFLQNRYTWIDLTSSTASQKKKILDKSVKAVTASKQATRIVLATKGELSPIEITSNNTRIQLNVIVIGEGDTYIETWEKGKYTKYRETNTQHISINIIENTEAVNFNWQEIKKDMHNQGIPTHHTSTEPKWQTERTGTPKTIHYDTP